MILHKINPKKVGQGVFVALTLAGMIGGAVLFTDVQARRLSQIDTSKLTEQQIYEKRKQIKSDTAVAGLLGTFSILLLSGIVATHVSDKVAKGIEKLQRNQITSRRKDEKTY